MKKVFGILLILSFLNGMASAENLTETESLSISEIKRQAVVGEQYLIQGYVTLKSTCPPCPKGAMCKPCLYDGNIVVSEKNEPRELYNDLKDIDLVVFTKQAETFKLGQHYWFRVHILSTKSTGQEINDVELIDWNQSGIR